MPIKYALLLILIALGLIFSAPYISYLDINSANLAASDNSEPLNQTHEQNELSSDISFKYDSILKNANTTVILDLQLEQEIKELYLLIKNINSTDDFQELQVEIALKGFEFEQVATQADSLTMRIGPFKSASERNNFRQELLKFGIESTIY